MAGDGWGYEHLGGEACEYDEARGTWVRDQTGDGCPRRHAVPGGPPPYDSPETACLIDILNQARGLSESDEMSVPLAEAALEWVADQLEKQHVQRAWDEGCTRTFNDRSGDYITLNYQPGWDALIAAVTGP